MLNNPELVGHTQSYCSATSQIPEAAQINQKSFLKRTVHVHEPRLIKPSSSDSTSDNFLRSWCQSKITQLNSNYSCPQGPDNLHFQNQMGSAGSAFKFLLCIERCSNATVTLSIWKKHM